MDVNIPRFSQGPPASARTQPQEPEVSGMRGARDRYVSGYSLTILAVPEW